MLAAGRAEGVRWIENNIYPHRFIAVQPSLPTDFESSCCNDA